MRLVFLTSADLNHLATKQYEVARFRAFLRRRGARLVVATSHLVEWLPTDPSSLRRRLGLADVLPMVWANPHPPGPWVRPDDPDRFLPASAALLRQLFYAEDGSIPPNLTTRQQGEAHSAAAEFWSRLAQQPERLRDERLVEAARKFDGRQRHARVGVSGWASSLRRWERRVGVVRAGAGVALPTSVKRRVTAASARMTDWLERLEKPMALWFIGVSPSHGGFRLWWETRRQLLGLDADKTNLEQRMDLEELKFWPLVAAMSLDKRMYAAVERACRVLGWDVRRATTRFECAGDERRLLDGLERALAGSGDGLGDDGAVPAAASLTSSRREGRA